SPGCICHGASPSSDVIVTINGPDSLMPNQTANYSVTISGGPLNAAGTNIAVSSGTLSPASSDLRQINGELTHASPKAPSTNVVTFNFSYTAPSEAGTQTIYANGNSVNFNGQNSGDQWNFAPNKIIQVGAITGIRDNQNLLAYRLEQNFPNPFNPLTNFEFQISKSGLVTLKVYDTSGKEVAVIVDNELNTGKYQYQWNAGNLASGVYFYQLKAGGFTKTMKLILMK
ncbi:MAG: T9SS type A sorting domain-containing protein, partial [Ignavibacteriaceae bacterium]